MRSKESCSPLSERLEQAMFLGHPGLSEINHNDDKHCELSLHKLDVSYASQK